VNSLQDFKNREVWAVFLKLGERRKGVWGWREVEEKQGSVSPFKRIKGGGF